MDRPERRIRTLKTLQGLQPWDWQSPVIQGALGPVVVDQKMLQVREFAYKDVVSNEFCFYLHALNPYSDIWDIHTCTLTFYLCI